MTRALTFAFAMAFIAFSWPVMCAAEESDSNQPETVIGTIIQVDVETNEIKLKVSEGQSVVEKTFAVTKDTKLVGDANVKQFGDIHLGTKATITLSADGKSVAEIDVGTFFKWYVVIGGLAAFVALSFGIGNYFAKSIRMVDYGWKIGVIASSVSCACFIVAVGWPPRFGVDLRGGVTMIYEIQEPQDPQAEKPSAEYLATRLQGRVDPAGTKEVVIRAFGQDKIEIIVPDVGAEEVDNIKRRLATAGFMQFRILANLQDNRSAIDRAREASQLRKKMVVDSANNPIAQWVGVKKETREETKDPIPDYKVDVSTEIIREKATGKEIDTSRLERNSASDDDKTRYGSRNLNLNQYLQQEYKHDDGRKGGIKDIEVLVAIDKINLEGKHLSSVRSSFDQNTNPCINFNPTSEGARLFGKLTSANLPEPTGFARRLGIVLDEELISAPSIRGTITSRGQITGRFTMEEVNQLVDVLREGKLPAALKKQPLSQDRIDSHLGIEMRQRGIWAIGSSMLVVLVFMMFYYRFSGVVACLALLINLVCILAMIILVKQPFSLTGLAGLVLTVGMSVDANVLIFERIREELDRGSTLRMAIRNGFGRATTTIVDANLTTLLTAIVLYGFGTEQIRGFAVSLILGILMCMFTAIFCSRVVFDIAERQRWITKLSMMRIVGVTHFDFIGKRGVAAVLSIILLLIGMFAVFSRGRGIYAIDLSGGTSIRVVLSEPMSHVDARKRIGSALDTWDDGKPLRIDGAKVSYAVTPVTPEDLPNVGTDFRVFKVDTSIPAPEPIDENDKEKEPVEEGPLLADIIKKAFTDDGGGTLLAMVSLDIEDREVVKAHQSSAAPDSSSTEVEENGSSESSSTDSSEGGESSTGEPEDDSETSQPDDDDGARLDLPARNVLALADPAAKLLAQADDPPEGTPTNGQPAETDDSKKDAVTDPTTNSSDNKATTESEEGSSELSTTDKTTDGSESETEATDKTERVQLKAKLKFQYEIDGKPRSYGFTEDSLIETIQNIAKDLKILTIDEADIKVSPSSPPSGDPEETITWNIELTATEADGNKVLDKLKTDFDQKPYFRGESGVGSQIAENTQLSAMGALLASLIGIVAYIWIRFQKVVFGLAAVVALVHDVLFVLGAIAVSYWFAGSLGFLGIEEFKISLPVVAAFLTIIGYSLNDTIVVFDRIREVRGKSPELTEDMINKSIGQTLSRTLLTSMTTLIVVVILYFGGGESIHGFAFALVVGVIVGTYSSIFVASPVLLWLVGSTSPPKTKAAV